MEDLISIFKEKKLKLTPQRIAAYEYLKSTTSHPSAEKIYSELHEQYPTMSLATLYKSLKTLASVGLIQELNLGENNFRYDANVHEHAHIKCVCCGEVSDIHGMELSSTIKDVASNHTDYKILSSQIYLYGICSKCQNKTVDEEDQE